MFAIEFVSDVYDHQVDIFLVICFRLLDSHRVYKWIKAKQEMLL